MDSIKLTFHGKTKDTKSNKSNEKQKNILDSMHRFSMLCLRLLSLALIYESSTYI